MGDNMTLYIEPDEESIPECPNCGNKLVEIVYGLVGYDVGEKAMNGELFLGGCMVSDNDPIYHCNYCRRSYYENLKDYIDEPNNWDEEDIEILDDVSESLKDADKELINFMTGKKED